MLVSTVVVTVPDFRVGRNRVMQLTAIGLVSLNSNSETHNMTAICDARLIYGRGRISPVLISGAVLG